MRRQTVGALALTFTLAALPALAQKPGAEGGGGGGTQSAGARGGEGAGGRSTGPVGGGGGGGGGDPPAAARWVPPPSHLLRRRPECPACRRHLRRLPVHRLETPHPLTRRIAIGAHRVRGVAASRAAVANPAATAARVTAPFLADRADRAARTDGANSSGRTNGSSVDVERERKLAGSVGAATACGAAYSRPRDGRVVTGQAVERTPGSRPIIIAPGYSYYPYYYPYGYGYGLGFGLGYLYYDPFGTGGYGYDRTATAAGTATAAAAVTSPTELVAATPLRPPWTVDRCA